MTDEKTKEVSDSFTNQVEENIMAMQIPPEVADDVAETVRGGGEITAETVADDSIAIPYISREAALEFDPTAMDAVKETDPFNQPDYNPTNPAHNPFAGLSDDEIAQLDLSQVVPEDNEETDTEIEGAQQWADTETPEPLIINKDGSTATVVQQVLHIFADWLAKNDNLHLTNVLAEQQKALKHSDAVIHQLETQLESYEQTELRDIEAANLWKAASDVFNNFLADQPENELNTLLLDRIISLLVRLTQYDGELPPMLAETLAGQPEDAIELTDVNKLYLMIQRLKREATVGENLREDAAKYADLSR